MGFNILTLTGTAVYEVGSMPSSVDSIPFCRLSISTGDPATSVASHIDARMESFMVGSQVILRICFSSITLQRNRDIRVDRRALEVK
jgi:hypothetical protein